MLGVLLHEPELQRRVEPGRPVRVAQVHALQGLLHHLTAAAPSGVARPPSAAVQGVLTSRLRVMRLAQCSGLYNSKDKVKSVVVKRFLLKFYPDVSFGKRTVK